MLGHVCHSFECFHFSHIDIFDGEPVNLRTYEIEMRTRYYGEDRSPYSHSFVFKDTTDHATLSEMNSRFRKLVANTARRYMAGQNSLKPVIFGLDHQTFCAEDAESLEVITELPPREARKALIEAGIKKDLSDGDPGEQIITMDGQEYRFGQREYRGGGDRPAVKQPTAKRGRLSNRG